MAVQVSYPGVYIEEFAPGAPIQGVGTSTAAFIGIAPRGDLDTPTKLTSFDEFARLFGDQPVPGFYLWHAVRGFFENGGQVCSVVRASNGAYGELMLANVNGDDTIRVRARQPGNPATPITIAVARQHLLTAANTSLFQPAGQLASAPAGRDLTLNAGEGAQFRPGDEITVAAAGERAIIVRVTGDTLRIGSDLANAYAAGDPVRLADLAPGARTVRITSAVPVPPGRLVAGTILTIVQGALSDTQIVDAVHTEHLGGGVITYRVTFRSGLGVPLDMTAAATVESQEFTLTVAQGAATSYAHLGMDSAHPSYAPRIINADANALVRLELIEPPPPIGLPASLPDDLAATALAGGADEDLTALTDADFLDALATLEQIDDVNLISCPDRISTPVQQALVSHCELLGDRFAVLDTPAGLPLFGASSIDEHRNGLDSTRGYAGLYYPWLRVRPVGSGDPILVPPSGHVCGIIARSDLTRGVHKAPANENVNGAVGVERAMSDIDQGQINLRGINALRVFSTGGRVVLWGARTTATDRNWQYVNIRRLFLYLEESIEEGIRWAVFEPNNLGLWQKLKRTISEFLTRAWRDGALFGATPEDAFYVRIDEILNPFSEQALGRLHIEIGARPSYPAEFIIVRIGIWQGGSEITEG